MLTPRQKECFDFIAASIASKGFAPSYQEIQDGLRLTTKSRVSLLVKALVERGYIRHIPNLTRAIEIVERSEHVPGMTVAMDALSRIAAFPRRSESPSTDAIAMASLADLTIKAIQQMKGSR